MENTGQNNFSRQTLFGKLRMLRWYSALCWIAVAVGWMPSTINQPMIHGGTLLSTVVDWAGLTFGCYCSLELVRSDLRLWHKAAAIVRCFFYGLPIVLGLYYAIPYLPEIFPF